MCVIILRVSACHTDVVLISDLLQHVIGTVRCLQYIWYERHFMSFLCSHLCHDIYGFSIITLVATVCVEPETYLILGYYTAICMECDNRRGFNW
jgi:hypothetical protein